MDEQIADRALTFVSSDNLERVLVNTIARVIEEIDWDAVSTRVRDAWRSWIDSAQVDGEFDGLREVVEDVLGNAASVDRHEGITFAAYLADEPHRTLSDETLARAHEAISTSLVSEIEAAHNGQYGFGGISPANVAVAFAIKYQIGRAHV